MTLSTPLHQVMQYRFTSIEINSNWEKIITQFQNNPLVSYLPIVESGKFIGVVYRSKFIKSYMAMEQRSRLEDLICKNIITLSPNNSFDEAKEVFQYGAFP